MAKEKILTAMDIGSSEIKVAIGIPQDDQEIRIIGVGSCASKGVKKGVVININDTLRSIAQAVSDAEDMAGIKVQKVYASVSGNHIEGFSSDGIFPIRGSEIDKEDIKNVISACLAVKLDSGRELLHTLPQEYIVDGVDGIRDPVGISGVRLEARVYVLTASYSSDRNIVKCINQNGFEVGNLMVSAIASASSVLREDEKELGVLLLDIGAGTTDIAVYKNGATQFVSVIPLGGNNITSDLATGLKTPIVVSEAIKKSYSPNAGVFSNKTISVPVIGGKGQEEVSTMLVSDIIEARVKEIFKLACELVKKSCDFQISSVVLCGGTANLRGIEVFAEDVFKCPTRVAEVIETSGLADLIKDPQYATISGLLKLANLSASYSLQEPNRAYGPMKILKKLGSWLCENF